MDYQTILEPLTDLGPRVAGNETKAGDFLEKYLVDNQINFRTQPFKVEVPICRSAKLLVDGESIPCLGSSLVSGAIPDGEYLISHFGYSGENKPYNIAYNPMTDDISVVDHFNVPSVTVSRNSVVKIIMGKDISGEVVVEKVPVETRNILVGNVTNPRNIIIAHYDSIVGPGAVDNAGSVAVLIGSFMHNPDLLSDNLYVLSGNEEMAYDEYKLSGFGFRVFENDYKKLLLNAEQIIVADGVGADKPLFSQSGLDWVLQVRILDQIRNKVYWLQTDQTPVLKVFHTQNDKLDYLSSSFLQETEKILIEKIIS